MNETEESKRHLIKYYFSRLKNFLIKCFWLSFFLVAFFLCFYPQTLDEDRKNTCEKKHYCMNGIINCIDGSFSLFFSNVQSGRRSLFVGSLSVLCNF
jgi:hypothetical protein